MERERGRAPTRKKGGRPGGGGGKGGKGGKRPSEKKSAYFLKPGKQGAVSVLRHPIGNRIEPKLCGTMPTRALAIALVNQLERAESVVKDLFLEATDDGIEALEAILRACRESVERRGARQQQKQGGGGNPGGAPAGHQKHQLPRGQRDRRPQQSQQQPQPSRSPAAADTLGDGADDADPYADAPAPAGSAPATPNGVPGDAEPRRPRRRQGRRRRPGGGGGGGGGALGGGSGGGPAAGPAEG